MCVSECDINVNLSVKQIFVLNGSSSGVSSGWWK